MVPGSVAPPPSPHPYVLHGNPQPRRPCKPPIGCQQRQAASAGYRDVKRIVCVNVPEVLPCQRGESAMWDTFHRPVRKVVNRHTRSLLFEAAPQDSPAKR